MKDIPFQLSMITHHLKGNMIKLTKNHHSISDNMNLRRPT